MRTEGDILMVLDMSSFTDRSISEGAAYDLDLRKEVARLRPTVKAMVRTGIIPATESFGFAVGVPGCISKLRLIWNNPKKFVWFIGGWGPKKGKLLHAANAIRVLRAALREGTDTLALCLTSDLARFRDVVESEAEEGSGIFPWGDLALGGGVLVPIGTPDTSGEPLLLPVAVSCFQPQRNPIVAGLIGRHLAARIVEAEGYAKR